MALKKMMEHPSEIEVVGAARSAASAQKLESMGAKTVMCDLTRPESAEAAMSGIDVLVILSSAMPQLNKCKMLGVVCKKICRMEANVGEALTYEPGAFPVHIDWEGGRSAIDAAKSAGVKHVIYIGSMGGTDPNNFLNTMGNGNIVLYKRKAEMYLIGSGIPYTIIHPGGLLPHRGNTIVPGGERELLVGINDTMMNNDSKERCIPREDLAEVVTQCVLEPEVCMGKVFDVSSKDPSLGGQIWDRNLKTLLAPIADQKYDYSQPQHPILEN